MPRQPYVPLGSLRAALAYPSPENTYKDEELRAVLKSASLERLASSLDRVARWDRELNDDEQQYLVFARIVLHKPHWVVIDAIINIGRPETQHPVFKRVLHLTMDPRGVCFVPDPNAISVSQKTPVAVSKGD